MADPTPATERAWLAAVLDRYQGPLVRYAARITGNLESACDVVQETFLRLYAEDRSKLNGHETEWLYRVCRNQALDVRRKDGRMISPGRTAPQPAPPVEACPSAVPTPAERAETRETTGAMLRELARLSDNQQEVLRLRFHAGLSYREISGVTGLTVTNVGYLIHTAINGLRERLGVDPAATPVSRKQGGPGEHPRGNASRPT